MKRMVSLLLALVLALVLAGCGASKAAGGASDSMAASEPEAGYWSNNSKSDDSYDGRLLRRWRHSRIYYWLHRSE